MRGLAVATRESCEDRSPGRAFGGTPPTTALRSHVVSNLDKRSGYTPRRAREQRAYRLVVAGGTAGVIGVVGLVLAVAGVIGAGLPVIALIVAAICVLLFRRTVSGG
jgi:hypothetical protein